MSEEKKETLNEKIKNKSSEIVGKTQANNIPANLAGAKSSTVLDVLNVYRSQISQAVGKRLDPDRLIQIACTLITSNPKIAECSTKSIIGAVMQASILGFKPVTALGQCYFVPYNKEVQFQIGYKGYISLARRSGEIEMIFAEVVREGDIFNYTMGLRPDIKHLPSEEGSDKQITHVYAVVHYKGGGYNFIVLTHKQIESYRKRSPMQGSGMNGAWKTDYDAMAKKTAIRRLATYMPLDSEVEDTLVTDEKVISVDDFVPNEKSEIKIENLKEAEYEDVDLSEVNNQFESKEGATK